MLSINMFVPDCAEAFEFYKNALGAILGDNALGKPIGSRMAKFTIGSTSFAMVDMTSRSPKELGVSPICIQLESQEELEERVQRVLDCGAKLCEPSTEATPIFDAGEYRCCNVYDPAGFVWSLSQRCGA